MRIGLFSDAHDHVDHVRLAVERFNQAGCELVVFAGDFVSPIVVPPLRKLACPMIASFGDNEGNRIGIEGGMRIIGCVGTPPFGLRAADGTRILVTHILTDLRGALGDAEIVVFGHTHRPEVFRDEQGRLFVNPGETSGWMFRKPTIALLETTTREVEIVPLVDGQ